MDTSREATAKGLLVPPAADVESREAAPSGDGEVVPSSATEVLKVAASSSTLTAVQVQVQLAMPP